MLVTTIAEQAELRQSRQVSRRHAVVTTQEEDTPIGLLVSSVTPAGYASMPRLYYAFIELDIMDYVVVMREARY